MTFLAKALTIAIFAFAVGATALGTTSADAGPRGVRTVSGMDLGSGR